MTPTQLIRSELETLIVRLEDGARLPTVRDLMRRFAASQGTVQIALGQLRDEGLLFSQVGRGTFVVKPGAAPKPAPESGPESGRESGQKPAGRRHPQSRIDSYLLLSPSLPNERSVLVQNGIQTALSNDGIDVVQMTYQNTDHLLEILGNAPVFGAAILQSQFETVPVRLLHMLKQKSEVVVADGHSISGIDIDRVGTDWTEAVDDALEHLTGLGHRRIGLVTIDSDALPIIAARRYFGRLDNWRGSGLQAHLPMVLSGVADPTQAVTEALGATLQELVSNYGGLPFTALLSLGISDGPGVRQCMDNLSLTCPGDLSFHMLGHCDVPSEHFQFYTMSGPTYRDAIKSLVEGVRDRLSHPDQPPRITYLPVQRIVRASTAAPS